MEGGAHTASLVAWSGFALALIFGVVGSKTNFCTMGAVSDIVNMGDWSRMRMWLLAIAVAIAGATMSLSVVGAAGPVWVKRSLQNSVPVVSS